MACVASLKFCATCETLTTEQKRQLGILLCIGCQKSFCSQHIVQHRQDLTDLFDKGVVNQRNTLQDKISTLSDQQWPVNIKLQLDTINKWELNTIELIKKSAEFARQHIEKISLEECDKLKKQFAMLSDQVITLREYGNYFENDIEHLTNKFIKLKYDIEHFPIELRIKEIPEELIVVKLKVPSAVPSTPSFYFVDQLLKSQKPKISFDLSTIKLGLMCPISDQLISFYSQGELPALNIGNGSWQSLYPIDSATELHWCTPFQQFLVLKRDDRNNRPNKLYQFNPKSGTVENISSGNHGNVTTLTCFKQHVLIVLDLEKTIEKWSAITKEWHTDRQSSTRWCPPISCQSSDKIKSIRMNDLYYALIIEKVNNQLVNPTGAFYFELRNHGMFILRHIQTDYNDSPGKMRLFSLPNESGWLSYSRGENTTYCYVFDNDAKRYDQNVVLLSNVTDIVVQNNLIFLRKERKFYGKDIIEVYDWQK